MVLNFISAKIFFIKYVTLQNVLFLDFTAQTLFKILKS